MYKYFVCIFVCVPPVCLVPRKVRMRHDTDFFLVGRQMERGSSKVMLAVNSQSEQLLPHSP